MSHASLFVSGIVYIGEGGSVHQDFKFLPFSREKKRSSDKKIRGERTLLCLFIVGLFIFTIRYCLVFSF